MSKRTLNEANFTASFILPYCDNSRIFLFFYEVKTFKYLKWQISEEREITHDWESMGVSQ